jgi:hypothetical protein
MVCFQTKNPNLDKFWRVLLRKMLVYFIDIWSILWSFGIFYRHFVYFVVIWYVFPVLVFCTKKNPATLQTCLVRLASLSVDAAVGLLKAYVHEK